MALAAGKLEVTLEYGQGLKDQDWFGKQDPYAIVRCGNQTMRSKTHMGGGKNPVWNETITFNIINENNLDIEIWDYDRFSADDKVGTCTVSLAQVRQTGKDHQRVNVVCAKSRKQHGFISLSLSFTANNAGQAYYQPQAMPQGYGYAPAPSFHHAAGYQQPPPYMPQPSFQQPPPMYQQQQSFAPQYGYAQSPQAPPPAYAPQPTFHYYPTPPRS